MSAPRQECVKDAKKDSSIEDTASAETPAPAHLSNSSGYPSSGLQNGNSESKNDYEVKHSVVSKDTAIEIEDAADILSHAQAAPDDEALKEAAKPEILGEPISDSVTFEQDVQEMLIRKRADFVKMFKHLEGMIQLRPGWVEERIATMELSWRKEYVYTLEFRSSGEEDVEMEDASEVGTKLARRLTTFSRLPRSSTAGALTSNMNAGTRP